jgi:hypothetical protein
MIFGNDCSCWSIHLRSTVYNVHVLYIFTVNSSNYNKKVKKIRDLSLTLAGYDLTLWQLLSWRWWGSSSLIIL